MTITTEQAQEQARALLQPIMDLMGGADGGVGFARLRHSFLPDMLQKAANGGELEGRMVGVIVRMSALCENMMGQR